MTTPRTWLKWWDKERAKQRLEEWVRVLIGARPFTVKYNPDPGPDAGSWINWATHTIAVKPNFPDDMAPDARRVPCQWGGRSIVRDSTLQVVTARALAFHEGGHVLFTDNPTVYGPTHKWLWNALEDERMERLTAAYYRPAARDFAELGLRCWINIQPEKGDRNSTLLNSCLSHRWDHERPAASTSKLTIPPDDHDFWHETIKPLVEAAWVAPTSQRVSEIALDILQHLDIAPENNTIALVLQGNAPDGSPMGLRDSDDPMIVLDGHIDREAAPTLVDDPDIEDMLLSSGALDIDPSGGTLWPQPYHELQESILGDVRRLTKELKVQTPDRDPIANNRRGRFDSRTCVRSKGGTPVVREEDEADDPGGMAIVLLLDGTTSMGGGLEGITPDGRPSDMNSFNHGRLPHMRRATLLFDRACANLAIPLCIGYARDRIQSPHLDRYHVYSPPSPVMWIRDWATPPNAEGPRTLIAGMYGDGGAEAVSQSLAIAQQKLRERTEARKLIIYIHDGQPVDEPWETVRDNVVRVRRQHTLVIGLFIGDQGSISSVQRIFSPEWTIGVANLNELPTRLGRILKKYQTTK